MSALKVECPLCYGYFKTVVNTPCCNTPVCKECLQNHNVDSTKTTAIHSSQIHCFICGNSFSVSSATLNIELQNIVDAMPVSCLHSERGCTEQIPKNSLAKHLEMCPYRDEMVLSGKEGYLTFLENSQWNQYWFCVKARSSSLAYFLSSDKRFGIPLGSINISTSTVIETFSDYAGHNITLKSSDREFHFRTDSLSELEEWQKSILSLKDYVAKKSEIVAESTEKEVLTTLLNDLIQAENSTENPTNITTISTNITTTNPKNSKIFVKSLTGKTITADVDLLSTTVGDLKKHVNSDSSIPMEDIILVHAGAKLTDDRAVLSSLNIVNLTTIILVVKPPPPTVLQQQQQQQLQTSTLLSNMIKLAQSSCDLGDFREALSIAQKAWEIATSNPHTDDLDKAACANLLGGIHKKNAQYQKALPLYQEALTIATAKLGENSESVSDCLFNLGDVHRKLSQYKEAKSFYDHALQILEAHKATSSKKIAIVLNGLGLVHKKSSQYESALAVYKRAIDLLNSNHPKWAELAYNLADVYRKTGKLSEAKELYYKSLPILEKTYNANHPEVAEVCNSLGMLLKKEGKYEEALSHYQRALKIITSTFGKSHPKIGIYLTNIGDIQRKQGNFNEAETVYNEALPILQMSLGPDHEEVAETLNSMGLVLKKRAAYDAAYPLYQRAVNIIVKSFGEKHYKVGIYLNNKADIERKRGEYITALSTYQKAYTIIEQTLGANHVEAAEILHNQGLVYHQLGKYTEAVNLFEKSLQIIKKSLGEEHYKVGMVLNNSGLANAMKESYQQAYTELKLALSILTKTLGINHVEVADCNANLGDVCMKLYSEFHLKDKLIDARAYYTEANKVIKEVLGPEHTKCKQFASLLFICESSFKEQKEDNRPIEQVNLILFDVSLSMTTKTKLSTKQVMDRGEISKAFFGSYIDKLIAFNYPHLVGLITFGEYVKEVLKITKNYEQFCKDFGSIQTKEGATACWDAIHKAVSILVDYKKSNQDKLAPDCYFRILCLTDGEDTASKVKPEVVRTALVDNNIIFDLIPIEGKHNLARAISNASGGFCFKVQTFEDGIALFEREAVLSLTSRAPISDAKPISPKLSLTQIEDMVPYVTEPKIKIPPLYSKGSTSLDFFATTFNQISSKNTMDKILAEYKSLVTANIKSFKVYLTDNLTLWKIIYIGAPGTPYEGFNWLLFLKFPTEFPQVPPIIRFVTPFYHCNVNNDGKICHEILSTGWTSTSTVGNALEAISNLIKTPNSLNALDTVKGSLYVDNKETYLKNAKEHSKIHGKSEQSLRAEFHLSE